MRVCLPCTGQKKRGPVTSLSPIDQGKTGSNTTCSTTAAASHWPRLSSAEQRRRHPTPPTDRYNPASMRTPWPAPPQTRRGRHRPRLRPRHIQRYTPSTTASNPLISRRGTRDSNQVARAGSLNRLWRCYTSSTAWPPARSTTPISTTAPSPSPPASSADTDSGPPWVFRTVTLLE